MVNTITNSFIFIILSLALTGAFAADEAKELVEQVKQAPAQIAPAAPSGKILKRVRRKRKSVTAQEAALMSKIGFSAGAVAWGEQILLRTADGRTENILVEYTGLAVGLDYTLAGDLAGWYTSVKTMFLQGQAQAEGQSITYQNKIDAVTAVFATTGLRFYPHEKVNVTLSAGATYYKLNLEPPTSVVTSYDFKYAEDIQPVAQLQLGWMLNESLLFQQEIFAAAKNNVSAGWIVSLGYIF